MITIKYAGFYSDVEGQPSNAPSPEARARLFPAVKNQPRVSDRETLDLAIRYLTNGHRFGSALGWSRDAFNSDVKTNADLFTDGEWVWPGDASYYCSTYGILPPESAFVEKVLAHRGQCPRPSIDALLFIQRNWSKIQVTESEVERPNPSNVVAHLSEASKRARSLIEFGIDSNIDRAYLKLWQMHVEDLEKVRDEVRDGLLREEGVRRGAVSRTRSGKK